MGEAGLAGHVGDNEEREGPFDSVFLFPQNESRGRSLEQ